MEQKTLSNRELAAEYRLEASKFLEIARRLEIKANLIELAENLHDFNARLSALCPSYIQSTFEDQLMKSDQDRKFLSQMYIAISPDTKL